MKYKIHQHASNEPMLNVNAFIVEAEKELVIVDTTLTMSDSKALRKKADELKKPLAGIIFTHAHPDHVAGAANIVSRSDTPIYALSSVKKLMEETEAAKHQQWSGVFGDEWVPKWLYPNNLVTDQQEVSIAGLQFHVLDLGSGGDCDANSIWLLGGDNPVAFIGDFVYNNNHTYMADGSILRWIANIERYSEVLRKYQTYYIGHGAPCEHRALDKQRNYLITYCAELLKASGGSSVLNDTEKKLLQESMFSKFPDYGCQFMVGLSADKVAGELVSLSY